uniref:Uncharacterized protein n=1 Tax=Tanacetum cinerariifolium TaxID=118510 RepID=A0A6L2MYD3_TANCI|nr:hypothetical protein [Tanacetum cinerariifolium]
MVLEPLAPTFLLVFFRNILALMVNIAICHFRSISSKSSASICLTVTLQAKVVDPSLRNNKWYQSPKPLSHKTITPEPLPYDLHIPTEALTPKRLTKRAIRIAQSKALSPDADEPASLLRDDRQGEAFHTVSSLDAGQDRENIAKTSAMPHESSPRVPYLDADEGNMQQRLHEVMELCTSLAYSRGCSNHMGIMDIGEELGAYKSTKKGSTNTEEMVNVLSSMEAAAVSTVTIGVPTVSGSFPTVAREMEEEFARENQRLSEQVARDSEIARIHVVKELKLIIEGLDRSNEVIAKHLSEYEQVEFELSVREKIEMINWEIHTEGKREYWKIIRLGGHTEAYQFFVDMLKHFDREDLHQLWIVVKETFSIKQSTSDKEKELWVELKRLFKPNFEDQLWTYH